jgi:hypothetical protein
MTDVNALINRLERARDGANVHTVNKAIFYLRRYSRRVDDPMYQAELTERLELHMENCQATLNNRAWSALAYSMRRWF